MLVLLLFSLGVLRVRVVEGRMSFSVDKLVALDLETYAIEPGLLTPRVVCGSMAWPGKGGRLFDRDAIIDEAYQLLKSDAIIVGANIAFDFGCLARESFKLLPLIFKAYDEGRVFDVQIAQALDAIYHGHLYLDPRTMDQIRNPETGKRGRYSLSIVVELVLGRSNAKENDRWRKSYALLDGVPTEQWPEDAQQYPVDDAVNTLECAIAQIKGGGGGCTPGPHKNIEDLENQAAAAFALQLGAIWGLRTDAAAVDHLRKRGAEAAEKFATRFKKLGFIREDGTEDQAAVKRAVVKVYGNGAKCSSCIDGKVLSDKSGKPINCKVCSGTGLDIEGVPRTKTGGVTANADCLIESGDDDLAAYGDAAFEKVNTTYIPFVAQGIDRPLTLRPNILVASGRTSYDGPIQQLPKGVIKGDIASEVRPCFHARPGYVYCSVDFAALELCTLSQVCLWLLGHSYMADTINASGDPGFLHTAFAARLAGVSAEEMAIRIKAKDDNAMKYRQAAKAGNFGLPGGMGAARFVVSKRKRSEGTTTAPDGFEYDGIRFCILLDGAERCGEEKVTMWPLDPSRGRPTPPVCKRCVQCAEELRRNWFSQWPEIGPTWKPGTYFEWVTSRVDQGLTMPCLGTYRERGGCSFTDAANNAFQALASDGAKRALWRLTSECYLNRESPLWGSRPVVFIHDEILCEIPEDKAHEAAFEQSRVMLAGMRELVPDVTVKAEPALCRAWHKGMEPAYDKSGRLIPWTPK
jgi:DNA polymerase-1